MTWRSLLISKGGKLSLHQQQMLIQQEGNEFTVPLEDIAIVVVESRETVITLPLLSAFGLYGITLLSCDEQFLPCGQWLPFNQYYRQLKTLKLQLETSLPLKKQLWQRIVQQKIRNQAKVLSLCQLQEKSERLLRLANLVKSGDKDNLEAQSAVIYFSGLFGAHFRRKEEDNAINIHLNYAYTVMRSAVARSLVLYGWLPQLGLFHHSELNAFNLADDFIEPFRPLVDLLVWNLLEKGLLSQNLTPISKQQLIKILHHQLRFNQEKVSVLTAIDKTIASLQIALIQKMPHYCSYQRSIHCRNINMSEEVFMRMIVLFDLPVTTKAKMRAANQFRQFLLKDGYQMLQLSIYTRIIKGRDALEKHHKRLVAHLPEEGSIRCLSITEKQFASMEILVGEKKPQEKNVNSNQLLLF